MSPSRASAESDFDSPRELILERSRELGISLKELSFKIGKNDSYMHQYIQGRNGRKSPKILATIDRDRVASLLGISVDALCPRKLDKAIDDGVDVVFVDNDGRKLPIQAKSVPSRRIPVYLDTDDIDPAAVREWVELFNINSPVTCGIWITQHHGRLRIGDLVYLRASQPARPGDIAVALDGQKIRAIGDLTHLSEDSARINDCRLSIAGLVIGKIVAIALG
jgi:hypothetical protein